MLTGDVITRHASALKTFVAKYHEYEARAAEAKGDKKTFLTQTLIPDILKTIPFTGYNEHSILTQLQRWFYNHGLKKIVKAGGGKEPKHNNKKPAAPKAIALFAQDKRDELAAAAQVKQPADEKGVLGANLPHYRQARHELWDKLSPQEKALYEGRAKDEKEKLNEGPPPEHIYENQKQLVTNIGAALQPLIGHGWGGGGDVAFFIGGVFRDEISQDRVIACELTDGARTVPLFKNYMAGFPEYKRQLLEWGSMVFPDLDADTSRLAVRTDPADGAPLLPLLTEDVPPAETRRLLLVYACRLYERMKASVPENVNDIVLSFQVGKHSGDDVFEGEGSYEDFYPAQMDVHEMMRLYERLVQLQDPANPVQARFRAVKMENVEGKGKEKEAETETAKKKGSGRRKRAGERKSGEEGKKSGEEEAPRLAPTTPLSPSIGNPAGAGGVGRKTKAKKGKGKGKKKAEADSPNPAEPPAKKRKSTAGTHPTPSPPPDDTAASDSRKRKAAEEDGAPPPKKTKQTPLAFVPRATRGSRPLPGPELVAGRNVRIDNQTYWYAVGDPTLPNPYSWTDDYVVVTRPKVQ
ncbi:hypothetical protein C8R46DRAFT_1036064 [Mycena filopes]|nr:hypothetical protein C8R46DRAFT_1036064 [Mycena filopes]